MCVAMRLAARSGWWKNCSPKASPTDNPSKEHLARASRSSWSRNGTTCSTAFSFCLIFVGTTIEYPSHFCQGHGFLGSTSCEGKGDVGDHKGLCWRIRDSRDSAIHASTTSEIIPHSSRKNRHFAHGFPHFLNSPEKSKGPPRLSSPLREGYFLRKDGDPNRPVANVAKIASGFQ